MLLVEGVPNEAGAVRDALVAAGIRVDAAAPAAAPRAGRSAAPYEAVVLANVHGADLRRDQMQALRRFVAEEPVGGWCSSGASAPSASASTPTRRWRRPSRSPCSPRSGSRAPSLALVLVVDRSGSMSGSDTGDRRTTRMELAKEGAIQAVETLQEGDQVGVVGFDYTPRWVAEVRTIRGPADMRAVADRIATVQPDGGTDIYSALDYAHRGLQQVPARIKHIILLTDGEQGSPAPFVPLINSMRRAGITLSTVGVSGDIGSRAQARHAGLGAPGPGAGTTSPLRDLLQLLGRVDLLAVHLAHDVTRLQAEAGGRRIAVDVDDSDALDVVVEAELLRQPRRKIGNLGAGEGAAAADRNLGDIRALGRTDQLTPTVFSSPWLSTFSSAVVPIACVASL